MKYFALIACLVLAACEKEEAKSTTQSAKAQHEKKAPPPAPVVVPQGTLPKMEAEKAKFIAVPSTPKDPEPKKDEKSKK